MNDLHTTMTAQLEQFTRTQKEALDALQGKGRAAIDGFERVARYQMDLGSDVVAFCVDQAKILTGAENPSDFFARQIDAAGGLAKTVEGRTNEFIELVSHAADSVRADLQEVTGKVADAASA